MFAAADTTELIVLQIASLPTAFPTLGLLQANPLPHTGDTRLVLLLPHPTTRCSFPACEHPRTPRPPVPARTSTGPKCESLHETRRPPLHRSQSRQRRSSNGSSRRRRPTQGPRINRGRRPTHRRAPHHVPRHLISPHLQRLRHSILLHPHPPHSPAPPIHLTHQRRHLLARSLQRRPLPPHLPHHILHSPFPNHPSRPTHGPPLPRPNSSPVSRPPP